MLQRHDHDDGTDAVDCQARDELHVGSDGERRRVLAEADDRVLPQHLRGRGEKRE
jgi:hypothetical protein